MDSAIATLCQQQVTIAPYTSQDEYGAPTYGAAKTYQARVVNRVRKVMDANGNERVSSTDIWLVTTDAIDVRSLLTLPAGFVPQTPPIMRVDRIPNETGNIDHVKLYA